MTGFGIQKKGTSPILAKRKKFKDGSYPLMNEVPEPKMERMPYYEDENYEPKMERMPYYEDKDYEPKPAKKKKK
jgi:hypothetical protein